jgi:hypothetical protein
MNDELERCWKEVVEAKLSYYPSMRLEGQKNREKQQLG